MVITSNIAVNRISELLEGIWSNILARFGGVRSMKLLSMAPVKCNNLVLNVIIILIMIV
jgi:hypothetical protein